MKYSGMTFCHNCIEGGYPIREAVRAVKPYVDEIVAVDCQSTDNTRAVLKELGCRIVDGEWGTDAEGTLGKAHALGQEACRNETIVHFEADEVWDAELIRTLTNAWASNAVVARIQVEQNFQRIRWAPHYVHRIFERGKATKDPARGHTTKEHKSAVPYSPNCGLIWDCSYVFRDNYRTRMEQNAKLWGESPQYLRRTPEHFLEKPFAEELEKFLAEPQWTWTETPLNIPAILRPLVGQTRYF